ncbi:MAG: class I SAM-dependent methyltransferase [Anaerolineae bacterium]
MAPADGDRAADLNRTAWDSFRRQRDEGLVADRRDVAAALLAGKRFLGPEYLALAGDVAGKRLLDLGCGDGAELLEWARLGAHCTGVDNSPVQLQAAARNAAVLGLAVRLVRADLLRLPDELQRGEFDIVYSAWVTSWIGDLDLWFTHVRRCLRPGGAFILGGVHPLGQFARGRLAADPDWVSYYETGPYVEGANKHAWNPVGDDITTMQWSHTLGQVVTAVAHAGLHLTDLLELPNNDWGIAGGPGEFVLRALCEPR